MSNVETLKKLQEQYNDLRKSNAVGSIQLNSVAGTLLIENRNVINTVLDTLIAETQKRIEKEMQI
ncbi:MAG: hypothetical protein IKZ87_09125 [Actinomycetaceae bacterium]|nr:hypothetical protein [Actinomycetaceae bacterium]